MGWKIPETGYDAKEVEHVCRQMCHSEGADPDLMVYPAGFVLPVTRGGNSVAEFGAVIPLWLTYWNTAEIAVGSIENYRYREKKEAPARS